MIKGAIFDCDGTLLDTMPLWRNAAGKYLTKFGVEADADLGRRFFELTLPESAKLIRDTFGLDASVTEIVHGIKDTVSAGYHDEVQLKPGVRNFLASLSQRGIPMSIVSSGSESLMRPAFERVGILGYFQEIFGSTECGLPKREPAIFQLAAQALRTAPEETWVFDDALYAIRVANSVGFKTVAMRDESNLGERTELEAEAVEYWEEFPEEIPQSLLD